MSDILPRSVVLAQLAQDQTPLARSAAFYIAQQHESINESAFYILVEWLIQQPGPDPVYRYPGLRERLLAVRGRAHQRAEAIGSINAVDEDYARRLRILKAASDEILDDLSMGLTSSRDTVDALIATLTEHLND